jgi:hypothetical protein
MTSRRSNHLIMGSAIGLAAIAVAIDHTRHRLPEAQPGAAEQQQAQGEESQIIILEESPCGLTSPCSLDASPCSLDTSPCSL